MSKRFAKEDFWMQSRPTRPDSFIFLSFAILRYLDYEKHSDVTKLDLRSAHCIIIIAGDLF